MILAKPRNGYAYRLENGKSYFKELFTLPPEQVPYEHKYLQQVYGEKLHLHDYDDNRRGLDKLWPPALQQGIYIYQKSLKDFTDQNFKNTAPSLFSSWLHKTLQIDFKLGLDKDLNPEVTLAP